MYSQHKNLINFMVTFRNNSNRRNNFRRNDRNFKSNVIDKNFLIDQIKIVEERIIDDQFINFTITKENNEINIFFDKENLNFVGWQTLDVYQNLNITYLSSLKKNKILKKNTFKLPSVN